MAKPKRWNSWRVCPECGGRATKLWWLSKETECIQCQQCGHHYDPPKTRQEISDE